MASDPLRQVPEVSEKDETTPKPANPNPAPPKVVPRCFLCGGEDTEIWLKGREILDLSQLVYRIHRCRKCGLKFVHPIPATKEMEEFYGAPFYFSKSTNPFASFLGRMRQIFPSGRVDLMTRNVRGKGALLDVGCGNGDFLLEMKRRGWQIHGLDISEDACRIASASVGESIFRGTLDEFLPEIRFDCVTLWHVLEHSPEPDRMIERIYDLLKPGGTLFIEVPNGQGICEIFRQRWAFLDLPRHIYLFSFKHLEKLLKGKGFEIHHRNFFSLPTSPIIMLLNLLNLATTRPMYLYYLIKRKNLGNLRLSRREHAYNLGISILLIPILLPLAFLLSFVLGIFGQGDVLTLIARKK